MSPGNRRPDSRALKIRHFNWRRITINERDVRRTRRVFVLNSGWYGLVPAAHSRVRIGQDSKSAQNRPGECTERLSRVPSAQS